MPWWPVKRAHDKRAPTKERRCPIVGKLMRSYACALMSALLCLRYFVGALLSCAFLTGCRGEQSLQSALGQPWIWSVSHSSFSSPRRAGGQCLAVLTLTVSYHITYIIHGGSMRSKPNCLCHIYRMPDPWLARFKSNDLNHWFKSI